MARACNTRPVGRECGRASMRAPDARGFTHVWAVGGADGQRGNRRRRAFVASHPASSRHRTPAPLGPAWVAQQGIGIGMGGSPMAIVTTPVGRIVLAVGTLLREGVHALVIPHA